MISQQPKSEHACVTDSVGKSDHVVVAFISSKIHQAPSNTDIIIENTQEGFGQTGLMLLSVIRLYRLTSIPIHLIQRELGVLPELNVVQIRTCIKTLFGLP